MSQTRHHTIEVAPGESVLVEFKYGGRVVAEAQVADELHTYLGSSKTNRIVSLMAGPVVIDSGGERHGADDGGSGWQLLHLGEVKGDG